MQKIQKICSLTYKLRLHHPLTSLLTTQHGQLGKSGERQVIRPLHQVYLKPTTISSLPLSARILL